jgi:hypothetical protein
MSLDLCENFRGRERREDGLRALFKKKKKEEEERGPLRGRGVRTGGWQEPVKFFLK